MDVFGWVKIPNIKSDKQPKELKESVKKWNKAARFNINF